MPVVFSGYCKSIESPANLYNPWMNETEHVTFDELATRLVQFINNTNIYTVLYTEQSA